MPETKRRDYYEILGVPHDADQKAIKDAFRKLALEYHPDRNKEAGAEERFKAIAEAYAVLSDPKKRADYDARGHAGVAGFSPEDLFSGIDFDDIFGGLGFDFGLRGGPFDGFFGRRRTRSEGTNLEVELEIPLERVLHGGEETLRFSRSVTCPACHGRRAKAGTTPRHCKDCDGSGQKSTHRREGGVTFHQITVCPACEGSGVSIDDPCPECTGRGVTEKLEALSVTIPKGIEEGIALRVPGHGQPSRSLGGTSGDLFVIVRTHPDPRFDRRGADLWREQTIKVAEAVLGTTLEVPTLEGSVTVKVPPGTQPRSTLRLRGKGLPEFSGTGRGDLYLTLQVSIPERLSKEERELYQRLKSLNA